MRYYKVIGFEDGGPVFWFTVKAKNFSNALSTIEKDYYMADFTFYKLEIMEVR